MAAGDGLVRPLNAPPGQQTPVGVQPGTTPGILIANRVIVFGANGGIFVYSGAPALGNLIASTAAAAGTDSFGNAYLTGFTSYSQSGTRVAVELAANGLTFSTAASGAGPWTVAGSLTWGALFSTLALTGNLIVSGTTEFDGTITLVNGTQSSTVRAAADDGHPIFSEEIELADTAAPSTPASGVKLYSAGGHLKTQSSDGAAYGTESIRVTAAGQTVSSPAPTFVNLTGLLLPLGVGTYQIRLRVFINANAAAGQWQILITAPAGATGNYSFKWESAAGAVALNVNRTAFAVAQGGPAVSVAGAYWATIEGVVTLTVAGNINVKGATSVAVDTWDVEPASYFEAFPVV